MREMIREVNSNPETVNEQWKIIKHDLGKVSEKVLGKSHTTNKPWFNTIFQEALDGRKIARERWLKIGKKKVFYIKKK